MPAVSSRGGGARGNRNSGGGRASNRDGIKKRRGNGPTKVDKDGDLDMDAPINGTGKSNSVPTGPRRSQHSSDRQSRPPKPTKQAQQAVARALGTDIGGRLSSRISGIDKARASRPINAPNTVTIKVEGLKNSKAARNEGGGLKELLIFLERKATTVSRLSQPCRIKKSHLDGDFVYITVSKEDGEAILKINGFDFAGTSLSITQVLEAMSDATKPGQSEKTIEVKEQLTEILQQRYDVNNKLLNLSNLRQDPVLNQMDFFNGENNPTKLFRAFMAICEGIFPSAQAKRDAIVSVSLTDNSIDDVGLVMSLADTFPELVHLDLSRNLINELKGLRKWQYRLRKLETLLLNENPIEVNSPMYKDAVKNWFPRLQNFSGTQVRTPEQVAAGNGTTKPTPIPQNGPDFRDINRVGEGFITDFIRMYDTDRHGLVAKYYDEHSTFSCSVMNRSPRPANAPALPWHAYIKLSRNHTKITLPVPRVQRLYTGTGNNSISDAFGKLPATQHPDVLAQFDKYMIDCHPVNGLVDLSGQSPSGVDGMIMTVHGEFDDQDPDTKSTTKRGFSRTFIIGPGAPGRNPIRVVSDMLQLKAYSPLPTQSPNTVAAPATPAAPVPVENTQEQMVLELYKQTGMTAEYSKMCLETANWNFDQALASFNEKKGQLPPAAFATATI